MSYRRRNGAHRAGSLIAALMMLLLLPATAWASPPPAEEPLAVIKNIVVGGEERIDADDTQVKVVRAATGAAEPVAVGMRLYANDEVTTTNLDVQVTILFLDGAPEKGNQVILNSDTRVQISSIFSWWGRFFASVKGYFDVKSRPVNLGVRGTEFEFKLAKDESEAVLTVLEGTVQVERVETDARGPAVTPAPELRADASLMLSPAPLFPSFAHMVMQDENQLILEGVAGSTTTGKLRAALRHPCQQMHRFRISMPPEMPWLTILAGEIIEVKKGELKDFELEVRVNGTNLRAAVYEGIAAAECVDCQQEPDCVLGFYSLPIEVRVKAGRGEQGPATDTGTGQVSPVQWLEELTLKPGKPASREKVTEAEVRSVLDWTNRVILTSQPSYSAENVLPHFASPSERSREFAAARFRAIWLREPGGYETLGDVYTDWGEGAKAVQSYEKELMVNKGREDAPDFLADLGEAYRLTGRFDEAEARLKKALAVNKESAPALNALGNVYLDRAAAARDKKDNRQARALLETAVTYYQDSSASPAGLGHDAVQKTVSQVNRGEAVTALGDLAQDEGRLDEARSAYVEAEQTLRSADEGGASATYPFTLIGLGRVYRQLGDVSLALNRTDEASRAYEQSEAQFNRALGEHGDMAEAHVGLGSVFERTGRKDAAVQSYTRATRLRPEQPEPYYNLSVLLKDTNPRLAAEYARTYLRLERPPLTQGQKGAQARTLAENTNDGTTVKVPSFKGDKQEKAVKEITGLRLKAVVKERPDCATPGKVLDQEPRKGEQVSPGSAVTIFVAAPGENAPSVPPLKGRQRAEAQKELIDLGFTVKISQREDSSPEGTVLGQEPEASTRLKLGCTVELTVAVPVPPVVVEDFRGKTLEYARRRLPGHTLGSIFGAPLTLGRITYEPSRLAPGTVINQDPLPGKVPRGTRVNLVVAGGALGQPGGNPGPQRRE